jgi:NADP-dependent aldehyde dehydrogenase
MVQGFDPRTGDPEGEPVPETTRAEVDALVAAAHAAAPAWGAWSVTLRTRSMPGRASWR